MNNIDKSYSYFVTALKVKIVTLKGGTAELADMLKLSRGYLANIASGAKTAGYKTQIKIANAFNYTHEQFIVFGKTIEDGAIKPYGNNYIRVPKVKAKLASDCSSLETDNEATNFYAFNRSWLETKGNPLDMVLMDVVGDSMYPYIMAGDVVMIDQSNKNLALNKIYAVMVEDLIYLKYIDRQPGKFVLQSYNPAYAPIYIETRYITENNFKILGQVIWWAHDDTV